MKSSCPPGMEAVFQSDTWTQQASPAEKVSERSGAVFYMYTVKMSRKQHSSLQSENRHQCLHVATSRGRDRRVAERNYPFLPHGLAKQPQTRMYKYCMTETHTITT